MYTEGIEVCKMDVYVSMVVSFANKELAYCTVAMSDDVSHDLNDVGVDNSTVLYSEKGGLSVYHYIHSNTVIEHYQVRSTYCTLVYSYCSLQLCLPK